MNTDIAAWLVILLAIAAANLPFLNEKAFGLVTLKLNAKGRKSLWWRLLELAVLYFAVGGVARVLESTAGNAFSQRWEFYAITVFLFLVFAFPGFVYRYLARQRT